MSQTVDQKVVEMKFDNRQFESNVSTSISTLDKLKKSLNLKGASQGLEGIDSAAKKCDFSIMSKGIDAVQAKFSTFQVMAVTALANITNSAVNAGKNIVKALTIDPIKAGFQEYETQINSIQTILANTESKGTNLSQVNSALNELNTYADKTIYNFTEMTRNIGTFTAAGIDLNTSVQAIKGIANLAAVSGSNSQQASTAMYQLSQALASGTVKLMDWNSVVNAGMGGQVFQDSLKETARLHGVAIDEMITSEGSFRETLQNGWLTSDILTETLAKFTGDLNENQLRTMGYSEEQIASIMKLGQTANDAATKVKTFTQLFDTLKEAAQSGWTKSWEIIVGDFGEAKELLTEISDTFGKIIGDSADARNDLLSGGLSSGWKQLLKEGISDEQGYIEELGKVSEAHGKNFKQMVADSDTFSDALKKGLSEGAIDSNMLSESVTNLRTKMEGMSAEEQLSAGYTKDMVQQIKDLDEGLKNGSISMDEFVSRMNRPSGRENLIEALRNSLDAVMAVIAPIKEAFTDIFPPATGEQLYNLTVAIKEFTAGLVIGEETSNNLKRTFKGLFAVLDIIVMPIKAIVEGIFSLFGAAGDLGGGILSVTAAFGDWLVSLDEAIKATGIFDGIVKAVVAVVKLAASGIGALFSFIGSSINVNPLEIVKVILENIKERADYVTEAFNSMCDALTGSKLLRILQTIWGGVKTVLGDIISGIGSIISGLVDGMANSDFSGILDLFNSAALGGVAVMVMKFVKQITGAVESFGGITEILDGVKGCLQGYQDSLKADTLKAIATAIAILAVSLLVLSSIDSEKMGTALAGITGLFVNLMAAMAVFDKLSFASGVKGLAKALAAMVAMSVAILILAGALKMLSSLELDELARGLVGVLGLTAIVINAIDVLSTDADDEKVIKGVMKMVVFAVAIKILASACKDLGSLNWEELVRGLVGVAGLSAAMVASAYLISKGDDASVIEGAGKILIFAVALKIMASVCKDMASLQWDEMTRGLAGIGYMLLGIALFTMLIEDINISATTSLSLVALGVALKIMASAVKDFSGMNWDELARGLVGMAGALTAVTLVLRIMPKNTISMGVGLAIVSASLFILAEVLGKLGGMSWTEIAKGLFALSVSIGVLADNLYLMNETLSGSAALLVAAAALAIFAPVLQKIGSMSLGEIAKGLVAIALALTILGIAGYVLEPVVLVILELCAALALIGIGLVASGAGLLAIAAGISALAAALSLGVTTIVAGLSAIILGIAELIPAVAIKIAEGIIAFCKVIGEGAVVIGEAIKSVVLSTVSVLTECVPAIVEGLFALLVAVLDKLVEYGPQIADRIITFIIQLLEVLTGRMSEFVDAIVNFLVSAINAISERIGELISAGVNLLTAIFQGIAEAVGPILELVFGTIFEIIGNVIVGIFEAIAPYIPEITEMFTAMTQIISDAIVKIVEALAPFMPNIQAMVEAISQAVQSICGVFSTLLAQIAPIIESITALVQQLGDTIAQIFQAIADVISACGDTISQVLGSIAEIIETTFSGISEVITSIGDSIRTVLDGIAGVIESIGDAAKNAGDGFESLANGVKTITELNLVDMATSMGAVSVALGGIASHADGLSAAGTGMNNIAEGVQISATAFDSMAYGVSTVTTMLTSIGPATSTAMSTLVASVNSSAGCFETMASSASTSISTIIASLMSVGSSASIFGSSISGLTSIVETAMSSMVSTVMGGVGQLTQAGAALITGLGSGISSQMGSVISVITSLLSSVLSIIRGRADEFGSGGQAIMQSFSNGIEAGSSGIKSSISSVLDDCISKIGNYYDDFKSAGKNLVSGFSDGISEDTWKAEAKASAMAQAAIDSAKETLAINSPSKVFKKIGAGVPEGFALGVESLGYLASQASVGMANDAISTTKKALLKMSDVIGNVDIDSTPRITPVMDMSSMYSDTRNVQIGATLSAKLLSGPVDSMSQIMARTQSEINSSNLEVVRAVDGLRDDLTRLYSDTEQEVSLYVDSKKLASSIAKPMNHQLSVLAKRGG